MAFNNTSRYLALVLSIPLAVMIFFSGSASALSGSEFKAGRIIDDAIFTNFTQMSVAEIQGFLNAKNSVCLKDYQSPEPLGSNQYGANVSAAKVIWKSARLAEINPRVLLVTLQKEQGLITRGDCPDWRYRTAMGFGCPDGEPCDEKWFGFSRQVYQGARHFRGFYDQREDWWIPYGLGDHNILWHPDSSCGSSVVNIRNRATASLYNYTPYQPNKAALDNLWGTGNRCSSYGNRNFWRDYTTWFGSTLFDIELLRNPDTGAIYLIENSTKRQLTSDGYHGWGFNSLAVPDVSTAELDNYTTLTPMLDRLVSPRGDNKIYFVDNGRRYHIANTNMMEVWGFASCDDVADTWCHVAETWWDPIKFLGNEEKLAFVVHSPSDSKVYMMDAGTLRHYQSANVLVALESYAHKAFFPSTRLFSDLTAGTALAHPRLKDSSSPSDEFIVSNATRHHLANGMADNYPFTGQTVSPYTLRRYSNGGTAPYFIQQSGQTEIYLVNNGKYQHVPTGTHWRNWAPGGDQRILKVSDRFINLLSGLEDTAINNFMAKSTNDTIYVIDDGTKHQVNNATNEGKWLGSSTPATVKATLLNNYPTGDTLNCVVTGSGPEYYAIEDGKKRWITTNTIYQNQYASSCPVKQVSDVLLSLIPTGTNIE